MKDYVEVTNEDCKYILHFNVNGSTRRRTIKALSETEAENVLTELLTLIRGDSSSNRKALQVYRTLNLSQSNSDKIMEYYEQYCSLQDEEIIKLRSQVAELRTELEFQKTIPVVENIISDGIILNSTLEDLFEDEVKYQVLSALESYYNMVYLHSDNHSRRADVLKDILDNNKVEDLRNNIKQKLEAVFNSGRVATGKTMKILDSIGLDMEKTGDGHISIFPKKNKKYRYSTSSTPSKSTAYKNGLHSFLNVLFK